MSKLIFAVGRAFQLIGLLVLPSAIWVGEIDHSMGQMILILVVSFASFAVGLLITKLSKRV